MYYSVGFLSWNGPEVQQLLVGSAVEKGVFSGVPSVPSVEGVKCGEGAWGLYVHGGDTYTVKGGTEVVCTKRLCTGGGCGELAAYMGHLRVFKFFGS